MGQAGSREFQKSDFIVKIDGDDLPGKLRRYETYLPLAFAHFMQQYKVDYGDENPPFMILGAPESEVAKSFCYVMGNALGVRKGCIINFLSNCGFTFMRRSGRELWDKTVACISGEMGAMVPSFFDTDEPKVWSTLNPAIKEKLQGSIDTLKKRQVAEACWALAKVGGTAHGTKATNLTSTPLGVWTSSVRDAFCRAVMMGRSLMQGCSSVPTELTLAFPLWVPLFANGEEITVFVVVHLRDEQCPIVASMLVHNLERPTKEVVVEPVIFNHPLVYGIARNLCHNMIGKDMTKKCFDDRSFADLHDDDSDDDSDSGSGSDSADKNTDDADEKSVGGDSAGESNVEKGEDANKNTGSSGPAAPSKCAIAGSRKDCGSSKGDGPTRVLPQVGEDANGKRQRDAGDDDVATADEPAQKIQRV